MIKFEIKTKDNETIVSLESKEVSSMTTFATSHFYKDFSVETISSEEELEELLVVIAERGEEIGYVFTNDKEIFNHEKGDFKSASINEKNGKTYFCFATTKPIKGGE